MKKLLSILLLFSFSCKAGNFYVSPTGTGTGGLASPFGFQTALNHPSSVHAGDTINLLAGTYTGIFTSTLTGTLTAPIIVRANPGDRVIIDGTRAGQTNKRITVLTINGAYTWYMGLEISNSDSVRTGSELGQDGRGSGLEVFGPGIKVINFIIHDCGVGLGAWTPSTNSEYYGSVIYNNGWVAPNGGTGHGIYTQNNTGTKTFSDNIILNNFGNGWQIYGSDASYLNNFYLAGNVSFNDRWLMGGISPIHNLRLDSNFAYNISPEFGYYSHLNDTIILNNNFFPYSMLLYWWKNVTASNNTIFYYNFPFSLFEIHYDGAVGSQPDLSTYHFSNNTYYEPAGSVPTNEPIVYWQNRLNSGNGVYYLSDWKTKGQDLGATIKYFPKISNFLALSGKSVFVRKNKYDQNRFTIIIYNWDKSATVNVGSILNTGDQYELHNVQNYFGDVITGVYADSLVISMTGHTVAKPLGYGLELGPNTFPEFGVFELIRKSVLPPIPPQQDSLLNAIQAQITALQGVIGSINARIATLETSLSALQIKVSSLKAITTIQ